MEYKDLIFKRSNLEANDSITTYNGWGAQQNPYAYETFFNLLKENKPKRILEIGTALGGFTRFLKYSCNELDLDCEILTYDIYGRQDYEEMISEGIDVRIENIFNNDYTSVSEFVKKFINQEGLTLVLCDGGNKILEFNILSNFLKSGDIIMAHDYARDHEKFVNEVNLKYWNWHEISEQDIKDACDRNNLTPYRQEIFDDAVWVCKIKQ
jgi:cephalosporin hydroxylase